MYDMTDAEFEQRTLDIEQEIAAKKLGIPYEKPE
jgi:hypothetical protein